MTSIMTRQGRNIGAHRRFIKTIVLAGIIAALPALTMAASDPDCSAPSEKDNNKDCGTHNMMIVGQEAVFLSHLPMFESEHRFQVILEVTLRKGNSSLDEAYFSDRKNNQQVRMYTLRPNDIFVISRMFPDASERKRSSFDAEVFRGHLERDGKPIRNLNNINAEVKRVVYAAELPIKTDPPKDLTYILFGKGNDIYVAHQIARAPDFDQLMAVQVGGQQFNAEDLERGILVTVPNRPNTAARRLKTKESVDARGQIIGGDRVSQMRITAGTEFYFEESELRVPPNFGQTAIEKAAGFK